MDWRKCGGNSLLTRPRPLPRRRRVLVAVRADVVERQEAAVLGQQPADLAEDTVDHRDVVGRGVVDHEIERSGRELRRVDVHLVVGQRQVERCSPPAGPPRATPRSSRCRRPHRRRRPTTISRSTHPFPQLRNRPRRERRAAAGSKKSWNHCPGVPLRRSAELNIRCVASKLVPVAAVVVDALVLVHVELRHDGPRHVPHRRTAPRPVGRSDGTAWRRHAATAVPVWAPGRPVRPPAGRQCACGMQRSSYSAMTISPASGPQAGQAGSRRTLKVRNDSSSAS